MTSPWSLCVVTYLGTLSQWKELCIWAYLGPRWVAMGFVRRTIFRTWSFNWTLMWLRREVRASLPVSPQPVAHYCPGCVGTLSLSLDWGSILRNAIAPFCPLRIVCKTSCHFFLFRLSMNVICKCEYLSKAWVGFRVHYLFPPWETTYFKNQTLIVWVCACEGPEEGVSSFEAGIKGWCELSHMGARTGT